MKCSKCGAKLSKQSKYCPSCGVRIVARFPVRECPNCHHKWSPRKAEPTACPGCGFRLDRAISVPEEQDMGKIGMTYAKCSTCGKETRLYVKVWTDIKDRAQNVCYHCRANELIKADNEYKEEDWEKEARTADSQQSVSHS